VCFRTVPGRATLRAGTTGDLTIICYSRLSRTRASALKPARQLLEATDNKEDARKMSSLLRFGPPDDVGPKLLEPLRKRSSASAVMTNGMARPSVDTQQTVPAPGSPAWRERENRARIGPMQGVHARRM